MKNVKIPDSILAILSNDAWKYDDYSLSCFENALELHKEKDERDGGTSKYAPLNEKHQIEYGALTIDEIKGMIADGVINSDFYDSEYCVNQHYLHSLHQFFAVCTKEWENHLNRTDKLIGTTSGRIWK